MNTLRQGAEILIFKEDIFIDLKQYFKEHDDLNYQDFEQEIKALFESVQDEKIIPYVPMEVEPLGKIEDYDTNVTKEETGGINDADLGTEEGWVN